MQFDSFTQVLQAFRNIAKCCLVFVAAVGLFACSAGRDASVTDQQSSLITAVYRINCGGDVAGAFAADQFATGGIPYTAWVNVSTAGVLNAAPAAVYQSERYGNHSYTFANLTAGASYTARLHFAETKWTSAGARVFNVSINGTQVLTNFDIWANAGANNALVLDFNTVASSSGQITIQYVTVVDNAKSSGIEILSNSGTSNQAPTIATPASASANPTTGTSTSLSVLGADDGGEANLTYTWASTGTAPGPVTFSANASNAAKNTTVTFAQAGSYTLSATVTDAAGASVRSNVTVVVNQQPTSIAVTPVSAQIAVGGTQQFSAQVRDQFGNALSTQPSVSWSVSGGGTISSNGLFSASSTGTFTISATSNVATGGASVTVTGNASFAVGSAPSAVYQINCGGGATGSFTADQFASGGTAYTASVNVATSGISHAAPAAVYQSERYGNHSYTFGGLTAGASYTARLHFAETKWTTSGARVFNVSINGAQVLSNFDIFAAAGSNTALVRDFSAVASSSGQITIQYVTVVDNAKSSGIEILTSTSSNQAPTIATAAAASPNPTSGSSSSLSVLGADDGGEPNLTYTWATSGSPPAPVSFSVNGTNAAKSTTASFSRAGTYALIVTVVDAGGASTSSNLSVVVNQKLTRINVTPASAQVATGGTQQFLATALDQFGNALATQPSIAWSVSGGGTINATGGFTAGSSSGGPFTVNATSGSSVGSASVSVAGGTNTSYTTDFNLTESPISEGGKWKQTGVDWTRVVTSGGLAFGTQSGSGGFNDSYAYLAGSFPANQSGSATIHLESGITATYAEVEILLRWTDSAHNATGYECNLAYNGQYAEIIKWPGPFATDKSQFTFISSGNPVSTGVHDGDVFQADVVGNVITARLNGRVIATGTDSSIPSGGAPGMGFYSEGAAASSKYSFTHYTGTGL
jgi:hypothetical protein